MRLIYAYLPGYADTFYSGLRGVKSYNEEQVAASLNNHLIEQGNIPVFFDHLSLTERTGYSWRRLSHWGKNGETHIVLAVIDADQIVDNKIPYKAIISKILFYKDSSAYVVKEGKETAAKIDIYNFELIHKNNISPKLGKVFFEKLKINSQFELNKPKLSDEGVKEKADGLRNIIEAASHFFSMCRLKTQHKGVFYYFERNLLVQTAQFYSDVIDFLIPTLTLNELEKNLDDTKNSVLERLAGQPLSRKNECLNHVVFVQNAVEALALIYSLKGDSLTDNVPHHFKEITPPEKNTESVFAPR